MVGSHRRHTVIPVALVVCPYGEIVGLVRLRFHAAACKVCGESLYSTAGISTVPPFGCGII